MTAMPIMVDRHHGMQLELGRGSNQVESGLALDADRLQSKRVASTHKAVSIDADTDCCSRGNAAINAGECAKPEAWGWREDGPS